MGAGTIYRSLLDAGLKPHQAAGFMGNFMEESTLNPKAYNAGEGAAGLAQWRGPRLAALKDYVAQNKGDINDTGLQAKFAVHEMSTRPEYRNSWNLLQGSKNADDAARAVTTWEKPAGYNPKTNDPSGVPSMGDRIGHAQTFLKQYGNAGTGADPDDMTPAFSPQGTTEPVGSTPTPAPTTALAAATPPAAASTAGKFMGSDAAIREGGGLIGMLNSKEGVTGAGLKTFLGGSEMKGAMGGMGMLAGAMGGGGGTPAPKLNLTVEDHAPDMSMLQMLMNKRKNAMVG